MPLVAAFFAGTSLMGILGIGAVTWLDEATDDSATTTEQFASLLTSAALFVGAVLIAIFIWRRWA